MKEKTKKKIIVSLGAAMGGISGITVASYIAIYDKIFSRFDRPDYSLKPGICCFDRVDKKINRKLYTFEAQEELLQGYYYQVKKPKGLVVVSHGFHSGADDYIPIILYMLNNKFNVFSFDCKGTYDSTGEGTIGMCESLVDLDNALTFISQNDSMNKLPLFLIGHSWGGYAVGSILNKNKSIKAVACISAMNDGYKMILEKGKQFVGKIANAPKPFLDLYQKYLFKEYVNYNCINGINSSDIPVIIAHGINDNIITIDDQSIVAHKNEITNKNVIYYYGLGLQSKHSSILYSEDAIAYQEKINDLLKHNKLETDIEIKEFYKAIDHNKFSQINNELFSMITQVFKGELK